MTSLLTASGLAEHFLALGFSEHLGHFHAVVKDFLFLGFFLQFTHLVAVGTAISLAFGISCPQILHTPNVPFLMRLRASSK